MHDYYIRKRITLKKQNPFGPLINFFILLIAIPVLAISAVSLLFYFFFVWITSFLSKKNPVEPGDEHYHYEMELLNNEYVQIILEEDERDSKLSHLNELWMENVYNKETCLYRARTTPRIDELEGKILCFYLKEKPDGVILQVLNEMDFNLDPLNSQLVFLDYQHLRVKIIDKAGDFYLHNDEKNANLIIGFNKKERVQMEIMHK